MKKLRILTKIALVSSAMFLYGFITYENPEKEEIRMAIEEYFFKGKIKADKELLNRIIHEDWRLHNVNNGKLVKYVKSDFFSWLSDEENSEVKFNIEYIDVTGNVAAAKTTEEEGDYIWVDYFNMVKAEGKWWIIDKVACRIRK
ncbi:nuclear transport factor 2 family protein [candidate division KSB1 bacterium]